MAALLVLVACSLPAAIAADGAEHDAASPADEPGYLLERAALEARVEGDRLRRASPTAVEDRRRSRTAYADIAAADAAALARQTFPRIADAKPLLALDLNPGERVVEYTGERTARVARADGVQALVESTLPLRARDRDGRLAPFDLTLASAADGRFEPRNPLVTLSIPRRLDEPVRLGDSGLALRPAGRAVEGSVSSAGGAVVYPAAGQDVDVVVVPRPAGVETFFVLRSERAEDGGAIDFDLPTGHRLRMANDGSGAAEVVRDGARVATIPPPVAADAEGWPVSVAFEVEGDRLFVRARHRGEDLAYPILVDPAVLTDSQVSTAAWSFSATNAALWSRGADSTGLYHSPLSGTFAAGHYGEWRYPAPALAYVYRVDFAGVKYTRLSEKTEADYLRLGIWGTSGWEGYHGSVKDPREIWVDWPDPVSSKHCTNAANCDSDTRYATDGNMARFQQAIGAPYSREHPGNRASFPSVTVWLSDDDRPTVEQVQHSPALPTGWVGSYSGTVTATGKDNGLGVYRIEVESGQKAAATQFTEAARHGCASSRTNPCPATWQRSVGYTPAEGISTYTAFAHDALAAPLTTPGETPHYSAPAQWSVKVDPRSPAAATISGELYDERAQVVAGRSYALRAVGRDGVLPDGSRVANSGVQRIEYRLKTGSTLVRSATSTNATCTPTTGCSADYTADFTVDTRGLADGDYTVEVDVVDQVGRRSQTASFTASLQAGVATSRELASLMATPALTVDVVPDRANGVPGDPIGYSSTLRNTGSKLELSGELRATNAQEVAAVVASTSEYVEYYSLEQSRWIALAGMERKRHGYTPQSPPPISTGLTVTATSQAADGVQYPATADGVIDTRMEGGKRASWSYRSELNLTPAQLALLLDPQRVNAVRSVVRIETVVDDGTGRRDGHAVETAIAARLRTQSGTARQVTASVRPPGEAERTYGAGTHPALASVASGASVSLGSLTSPLPVVAAKGAQENDLSYWDRLEDAERTPVKATGDATATADGASLASGTGPARAIAAPQSSAAVARRVPIASVVAVGPASAGPGQSVTYTYSAANDGAAPGTVQELTHKTGNATAAPVPGAPSTLAAESSGVAAGSSSYSIPSTQPDGDLTDTLTLRWSDANGNAYGPVSDIATTTVFSEVVLPAPELDKTATTPFVDQVAFLHTGPNAVQTGMTPGTIDALRGAVVRGRAIDPQGAPVSGAQVTVPDHAEYGSTTTHADGTFYMVVNGGTTLRVRLAKAGRIPAERTVEVPVQDYTRLDDVALVEPDPVQTTVDFGLGSLDAQVARGSQVTDDDGTRRTTVIFQPGTTATLRLPDGTTQPASTLTLRATEFTVGSRGEESMPATLPATSAYTFAADFRAAEAEAVNAKSIEFSQPAAGYVENFLGLPVGRDVPAGAYDPDRGAWIPGLNGLVVKVLSETAGMSDLDVDGSGQPATPTQLAALGLTDHEREQLANLYAPGQELWRVPMSHFTAWDWNNPWVLEPDAVPPPDSTPDPAPEQDPCEGDGSVIECENQTLREDIGLPGVPHSLHYSSDRAEGRATARTLRVPVSGATVPASLRGITASAQIMGRWYSQEMTAAPNQAFSFTWDGKDAFGRKSQGRHPVTVRLIYHYRGTYGGAGPATGFGETGSVSYQVTSRGDIYVTRIIRAKLGSFESRNQGLGGWSIDAHHVYDPVDQTLYLGDGSRRQAQDVNAVASTVAGATGPGFGGDGGPAGEASIWEPRDLDYGPDGSLYFADGHNNRVRRIAPDGTITTVAGTGTSGTAGDGGPATQAQLSQPHGVAAGPDGSVYITFKSLDSRVRRVAPNGIISTVAGTGTAGCGPDEVAATASPVSTPDGLAVGPDGSVYFADYNCGKVRKIRPDGTVITVAGGGQGGDGSFARAALLDDPSALALGPDGTLYIGEAGFNGRIKQVTPDGKIKTIAGAGNVNAGDSREEAPALEMNFRATALDVGPDGRLYMTDTGGRRVRRLDPDEIVRTAAGDGTIGANSADIVEGAPARQAKLYGPWGIAFAADGTFAFSDANNNRIRRIHPAFPQFSNADIAIPSPDGEELYQFDERGKHLRTVNTRTGADVFTFAYDDSGFLKSIVDGDGNTTTVNRAPDGTPAAITGPYGQRVDLDVNAAGLLARLTSESGNQMDFAYTADGLLQTLTDPNRNSAHMTWDPLGRLTSDTNVAGATKTLVRTDQSNGHEVTVSTELGRSTRHKTERLANGDQRRVLADPAGKEHVATATTAGVMTLARPDGTVISTTIAPDPRFRLQAPVAKTSRITTPGGRELNVSAARTASLSNPADPLSLQTLTETQTVNGRNATRTYSAPLKRYTETSAGGRESTTTIDAQGRATRLTAPGFADVTATYDSRGRTQTSQQGTRTTTYAYDPQGRLSSMTIPTGLTTAFGYDADGRLTRTTLPDGREVRYARDANGNVTAITPPGRSQHVFAVNPVGLTTNYAPPSLGDGASPTRYAYNEDQQLTTVTRPDDSSVAFGYDTAGRPVTLTHPDGQVAFSYDGQSGNPTSVDVVGGPQLDLGYDGALVTSEAASGAVTGSISRTYDNDLRIASTSVNGANPVSYSYDNDSLLTQAGSLALTHRADNGLLSTTTLGSLGTTHSFNTFGEPSSFAASHGTTSLFNASYTRDDLGRISTMSETVAGESTAFGFTYDGAGRLTDVGRNGQPHAHYSYDANGNRVAAVDAAGNTTTAAFDAQDRLVRLGTTTYAYTRNGELASKTEGGQVTSYRYDALGALTRVTKPGGTIIDYVTDASGRRVGKKVGGALTRGYLYGIEAMAPMAELNADGSVRSRFVYATRAHVPDYMVRDGVTYRMVLDHRGSVRLVVNTSTGAVAQRLEYGPFGEITADTAPGFQPFAFAGGLYDPDTGLTRFGARDYDARTGRWTAKDPIDFAGGDTNLYGYVLNDPVNFIDPAGLLSVPGFVGDAATFASEFSAGLLDGASGGLVSKVFGFNAACVGGGYVFGDVLSWAAPGPGKIGKLAKIGKGPRGAAGGGAKGGNRKRGRAPVHHAPYGRYEIYDDSGNLRQVTTYDRHGRRAQQYEFGPNTRHGEGSHTFNYDASNVHGHRSPHQPFSP